MAEAEQTKPQNFPGVDETGIGLRPRNFEELWKFAQMVCITDFVPVAFKDKPGAVIAACQLGHEVGLPPMTSLKWIAVINGTPSIWGDGYWMLVNNHPLCAWTKELGPDEALTAGYGECTIMRKGRPEPITRRFTKEMAEKAGLWGGKGSDQSKKEQSPWFKYPGRMLQMRARALCGRDVLPEATGPLSMREEVEDIEPRDVTPQASKPEPMRIPQPTKENADGDSAGQPERTDGPVPGETPPTAEANPSDSPKGDEGGKPAATAESEKPKEKTKKDIALETIAGFTHETFPEPAWMNPFMKGLNGAEQLEITNAFNDKKKELGIG